MCSKISEGRFVLIRLLEVVLIAVGGSQLISISVSVSCVDSGLWSPPTSAEHCGLSGRRARNGVVII